MAQPGVLVTIPEQDLVDVVITRTSASACLRGYYSKEGRHVSVKLLPQSVASASRWMECLRVTELIRQVQSERILLPLGLYQTRFFVSLVSDWMSFGSLHSLLYETQLYPEVPTPLLLRILLDVAEGLSHLHAIPCPHQSLKSTNVLLDHQYRAKLCDVGHWGGWSAEPAHPDGRVRHVKDRVYQSPEVLRGDTPSPEADLYSFSILLWETLNRRPPHEEITRLQEVLRCAQSKARQGADLLPPGIPLCHALTQMMICCWSCSPHSRPPARDCVLELRKALETFEAEALITASHRLREYKERALLRGEVQQTLETKIEIKNLEVFSGYRDQKIDCTKKLSLDHVQEPACSPKSFSPADKTPNVPFTPTLASSSFQNNSHPGMHCSHSVWVIRQRSRKGRNETLNLSRHLPASQSTPCGTPDLLDQEGPLRRLGAQCPDIHLCFLPGQNCSQILRERRELIVQRMTEGRLNNLLDVLVARQALTREAYELITAAMTLDTRTRCLLDTCLCLGEGAAMLVASALGLVSKVTSHCAPQMSR